MSRGPSGFCGSLRPHRVSWGFFSLFAWIQTFPMVSFSRWYLVWMARRSWLCLWDSACLISSSIFVASRDLVWVSVVWLLRVAVSFVLRRSIFARSFGVVSLFTFFVRASISHLRSEKISWGLLWGCLFRTLASAFWIAVLQSLKTSFMKSLWSSRNPGSSQRPLPM